MAILPNKNNVTLFINGDQKNVNLNDESVKEKNKDQITDDSENTYDTSFLHTLSKESLILLTIAAL